MASLLIFGAFAILVVWGGIASSRNQRRRGAFLLEYHAPADLPDPAAHEWRPLTGDDASVRVLVPHQFFLSPQSVDHISDAQWTEVGNIAVHVFDLLHEDRTAKVHSSCAGFKLAANCPRLVVWPKAAETPEGGAAGWLAHMHTVRFESDDFNLMFLVRAEDQRFAFSLIDAEMMRFLLAFPSLNFLAVAGEDIFVSFHRDAAQAFDREQTLQYALAVRGRIPRTVTEEWAVRRTPSA